MSRRGQALLAVGLLQLRPWKPRSVGFLGVVASAINMCASNSASMFQEHIHSQGMGIDAGFPTVTS